MSKPYRAGNGKFVRKDNPAAVIGRLREKREQERQAALRQQEQERRRDVARKGYRDPLTRAELAESAR